MDEAVELGARYRKKDDNRGTYTVPAQSEVIVVGYYLPPSATTDRDAWVSVIIVTQNGEPHPNRVPETFRRWHLDESFTRLVPPSWEVGKVYQLADGGQPNIMPLWVCRFVDDDGCAYLRVADMPRDGLRCGLGKTAVDRREYVEVAE